ncbi:hypothetical protein ACFY4B_27490 [Kitasatospora sp. NPDC001261]|uniref:hypothetical protein n=1 Tax=Kitasatospora sp. NPDC001261 TaxID=3364012 RepID=UPI0036A8571C
MSTTYDLRRTPNGTTAQGRLDHVAGRILSRHGFAEYKVSDGVTSHRRLADGTSESDANAAATAAANELRNHAFHVTLDPALGTPVPAGVHFVPTSVPDPVTAVADLAGRLPDLDPTDEAYEAALLADALLGPHGALTRITEFTTTLGGWCSRIPDGAGDDIAALLADSSNRLAGAGQQLADIAIRLRAAVTPEYDD